MKEIDVIRLRAIEEAKREVQKQREKYHNKRYINFRKEADKQKLKKDELEAKLDTLLKDNYKYIKHTTIRSRMPENSYSLCVRRDIISLTVHDDKKYYFYYTNYRDDTKNEKRKSPISEFKNKFKDRTGKTLVDNYGRVGQDFKICAPSPLYYINRMYPMQYKINDVCKEDFSSHYPSSASGILPDANTAILYNKYVEPNEEYKFAFYPDSGNVAVYGEFDSHNYIKFQEIYGAHVKTKRLYNPEYTAKDEHTILMKQAEFDMAPEMKYFYDIKNSKQKDSEEYYQAKLFMNSFLGMFEQNNKNHYDRLPLAHLAAVIKWRANIKMFNLIKKIDVLNVIQVCVDGIIHKGPAQGTDIKELGNLICEESKAKLIQRGINQYIIFGKEITKAHAGLDINIESNNIEDWKASEKVKFLDYIKSKFEIEEL